VPGKKLFFHRKTRLGREKIERAFAAIWSDKTSFHVKVYNGLGTRIEVSFEATLLAAGGTVFGAVVPAYPHETITWEFPSPDQSMPGQGTIIPAGQLDETRPLHGRESASSNANVRVDVYFTTSVAGAPRWTASGEASLWGR
jgi:hypothetical protein